LSHEHVLKALVNLGLKETEAEVYIYLATKGKRKARDIAEALGLCKQQIYRSLERLCNHKIVGSSLSRPAEFSAVSFEKVIDFLLQSKLNEANILGKQREEILAKWKSLDIGDL
jgi:sugar-specific transcriptional regulator TrmB